ncbi:MAG: 23S rRNA (adenine(2503)-C(2))-methyltransferase RlmN [Saprospiraceae bacterium]|nr:23S rRNA (adenine(2503)-C(2))-methyltransferase RlmN [Saprospiraceae bacterium]
MEPKPKMNILECENEFLSSLLLEQGFEKYRPAQIQDWLWVKAVRNFDQMTNLSKAQREFLKERFDIGGLQIDKIQNSLDGTIKIRFLLKDHLKIESVLIPVEDDKRYTVCVSSQAGCSLTCSFCATGKMGLLRQLSVAEIFDQFIQVNTICKERYGQGLSNIVFMGMGEPLLNYKNVIGAIRRLITHQQISSKRITLSTAGIAKMIKKLADENLSINLALSLHAANDEKRNEIMPINSHNNLTALLDALKYYHRKTGNKISYEYIAFDHYNDSDQDAKNLVKLCSHFPVMVNIIEYNPIPGVDYIKSSENRLDQFARLVRRHGVMITVRKSRGKDIDAACGQLANQE